MVTLPTGVKNENHIYCKRLKLIFRLALETLVKLGLNEDNVGMILSTRPFDRLERVVELLFENLNMVCHPHWIFSNSFFQEGNLLLAEMSIALLHKLLVPETELTNFVQKLPNAIGSLVAFIETLSPVRKNLEF